MKKITKKKRVKDYNNYAKWYDLLIWPLEKTILKSKRKKLISNAKGEVLEIAIGTGANLKYYGKECKRITGIDPSKEMLKKAKKKSTKIKIKTKLILGQIEKLKFKEKSFDTIVDTLGICTYKEPMKVIKIMKKLCKPKGRIILLEHGISNNELIRQLQKRREKKHYLKTGCSLIRNPEELVKKAGMKIIRAKRSTLGIIYSIIAKP